MWPRALSTGRQRYHDLCHLGLAGSLKNGMRVVGIGGESGWVGGWVGGEVGRWERFELVAGYLDRFGVQTYSSGAAVNDILQPAAQK